MSRPKNAESESSRCRVLTRTHHYANFSAPNEPSYSATESEKIFKEKQNKLHTAAAGVLH